MLEQIFKKKQQEKQEKLFQLKTRFDIYNAFYNNNEAMWGIWLCYVAKKFCSWSGFWCESWNLRLMNSTLIIKK